MPSDKGPEDPRKKSEKKVATDIEIVRFLIKHINEPCETPEGYSVRGTYIREAKSLLLTIKDPEAKSELEEVINKYSV